MDMQKIGSLFRYEREKKNVSREKICYGLCTVPMLYKLEENKCETDKLLLDVLFQRLGKSPDKLEIIITSEEYNKVSARDDIDELICKRDLEQASKLLEQYISGFDDENNVQQMYYCRTKAYLEMLLDRNEEAFKHIARALELTMPDWKDKQLSEYYISTYELENLLVYGIVLYKLGRCHEANAHIEECLEYITNRITDREEYAKIYPKSVYVLAKINTSPEDNERVIQLCEDGLSLLRKESISYFMTPLMEELISRYTAIAETEKVAYWKKYYLVLTELYKELDIRMSQDYLFFRPYQCEIHLDYETIKGERMAKGITQEKLIEEVYSSPETLSRIENTVSSPTKKKFEALMDKLGVDKTRYNAFMVTTSFEVLEMKNELDDYLEMYDITSAYGKLKEMEEHLDMNIPDNRRFIENIRNTLDRIKGNVSIEEALAKAVALLKETYNYEKEQNRPPMRNEAVLLAQVATILEQFGRIEEASDILERVIKIYERSKVKNKYRFRSYMFLCTNYERLLCSGNDVDASNKYSRDKLILELNLGKGSSLAHSMMILASNMIETTIKEEICKELLKKTYYLYDLFLQNYACKELEVFYKQKYDGEIC